MLGSPQRSAPLAAQTSEDQRAFSCPPIFPQGPAPGITDAQIIRVCSDDYQAATGQMCEDIARNQTETKGDHGGKSFLVITQECGIAGPEGATLTAGREYLDMLRETTFPQDPTPYMAGAVRTWDAHGRQGGLFRFEAQSINPPYTTRADRLYIH